MITDSESLAPSLRAEVQEHGALLNLFEEQQAAILRREPDLVLNLAEAITRQLDLIRSCQRQRKDAVRATALEAGCAENIPLSALIPHFQTAAQPLLEALMTEVNRLIRQTRRRARQNQMLLARTIETSRLILERLKPGSMSKTYSANGRVEVGASTIEGRLAAES